MAEVTEWRCFHCGGVFVDRDAALLHFGPSEVSDPICLVDAEAFREMEEAVARARAEDTDTDRAMYRMRAEHNVALRRAEEEGYAKGTRDERQRCVRIAMATPANPPYLPETERNLVVARMKDPNND